MSENRCTVKECDNDREKIVENIERSDTPKQQYPLLRIDTRDPLSVETSFLQTTNLTS